MTIDSRYLPQVKATDDDTVYTFEFEVVGEEVVEVYKVTDSSRTLLALNTDYTVRLDPYRDPINKRGEVVLTAPLADGESLQIFRNTPIIQTYTGIALEPFRTEEFELQMDRICMIEQEIEGHACDCRDEYTTEPPAEDVCNPPPCVPYACNAFELELAVQSTDYWPLTDSVGVGPGVTNPVAGEKGVNELNVNRAYFTPAQPGVFGADDCAGNYAQRLSTTTNYYSIQLGDRTTCVAQDRWYGGLVLNPQVGGSGNFFCWTGVDNANGLSNLRIAPLNTGSNNLQLTDSDGVKQVNVTVPDLDTKPFWWAFKLYEAQDTDNSWYIWHDLYINGEFVDTWRSRFGRPGQHDFSSANNYAELQSNQGDLQFSHLWYANSQPALANIQLAFERNFSDYTIPDWCATDPCNPPDCTPGGGQDCTQLVNYPTGTHHDISAWMERDGDTNIPQEIRDIGLSPDSAVYDATYTSVVVADTCFPRGFGVAGLSGNFGPFATVKAGYVMLVTTGTEMNVNITDVSGHPQPYPSFSLNYAGGNLGVQSSNGFAYIVGGPIAIPTSDQLEGIHVEIASRLDFTTPPDRWFPISIITVTVEGRGSFTAETSAPTADVVPTPSPVWNQTVGGGNTDAVVCQIAENVEVDWLDYYSRTRPDYQAPDWCDDLNPPDGGGGANPTRPDPECEPYRCDALSSAALLFCSSYWGFDDATAPTGTVPDELSGGFTWTVGAAFAASDQPGVYGTDDCASTYKSNSVSGEMTFDQTIPNEQWFGVVVTGACQVFQSDVVRAGETFTETLSVLADGTVRFQTWDGNTVDRAPPTTARFPMLVTWKSEFKRLINNVDGLIFNQNVLTVYADSWQAGQFSISQSGTNLDPNDLVRNNLRLQVQAAAFAHGFVTDDAGVVEMRLAHQRNFEAYNNGQAPTYCEDSNRNPDNELCVSPCFDYGVVLP